jgi:hypothetical protein
MAKGKKPVSLELAMDDMGADEPSVVEAPVQAPQPSSTVEKLTVYVPRMAAKRIKQMALDHDRRVNDFLQEGVDLMLAKYGQPSLKEFGG